ncbi:MAG: hypothetical protein ACR2JY_19495 [Chloroflexota bacterium]
MNAKPRVAVLPSERLFALPPCSHGSVTDSELQALGLERSTVIDFSASTNPLGPSPRANRYSGGIDEGRRL